MLKNWTPKMIIGAILFFIGLLAIIGNSGNDVSGSGIREASGQFFTSLLTIAMMIGGAYLFWKGGRGEKK